MNNHPAIPMSPVESSQIDSIGHDPATDILRVKFKSGGTYDYHGVSAQAFEQMKGAESIGRHLGAHIKPHHTFNRIGD